MLVPGAEPDSHVAECSSIRLLFAVSDCVPGQRFDPSSFPRALQAGWEDLGTDQVVALSPEHVASAARIVGSDDTPLVLLTRDRDTYWNLVGEVMSQAPASLIDANTGGLIGGPDQLATKVQQWLRAGLIWSLLLAGALFALGMAGDVVDRWRTQRALRAVGASEVAMRRGVLAEQGVRILAVALYAIPLGLLIAWISPGWLNRDAVPPGWMLTCLGALGAVLVLGTLLALLATRVVATAGHHAGDASMLGD